MALSWNEIKDRALRFTKEWAGEEREKREKGKKKEKKRETTFITFKSTLSYAPTRRRDKQRAPVFVP